MSHLCYCGAVMVHLPSRFHTPQGFLRCSSQGCDGIQSLDAQGNPRGPVTDKSTRQARTAAHNSFDAIWKDCMAEYAAPGKRKAKTLTGIARHRCYAWLADQMGLSVEDCHIGFFGKEQCAQVVAISQGVTYKTVRQWWKANRAGVSAGR